MDKPNDLEAKYHKLAAEYSKVRSQATVLKKAVLDEQTKTSELKEIIRTHEQTLRKHDQEMESLTFRNEQLTKRIAVLQQELQVNSHGKRGKQKLADNNPAMDVGVFDEEFQKKILENAELLSSISDKELEIVSYRERVEWLEQKVSDLEKELGSQDRLGRVNSDKLQKENEFLMAKVRELAQKQEECDSSLSQQDEKVSYWKSEADRLRTECELLRSKPTSNKQLTEYYESQLSDMLTAKTLAQSETKSLSAENQAFKLRLENLTVEHLELQKKLEKSQEELATTNNNYQGQLDAMTEHLAAQNEKITIQCDEIQLLKHRLAASKK